MYNPVTAVLLLASGGDANRTSLRRRDRRRKPPRRVGRPSGSTISKTIPSPRTIYRTLVQHEYPFSLLVSTVGVIALVARFNSRSVLGQLGIAERQDGVEVCFSLCCISL